MAEWPLKPAMNARIELTRSRRARVSGDPSIRRAENVRRPALGSPDAVDHRPLGTHAHTLDQIVQVDDLFSLQRDGMLKVVITW